MSKFAGMTVNERLWHSGLAKKFDSAIRARKEAAAIAILLRVDLSDEQAKETVATIIGNPTKYGFT